MHNNQYYNYSVTDFVIDDFFIKHYLAPTEHSTQFWANWQSQNPQKCADWDAAQQLLEAVLLGLNDYARTYLSEESQNRLLVRIQATNAALVRETPVVPIWRNKWVVGAAASFLLLVSFWFIRIAKTPPSVYEQQIMALAQKAIEKTNNTEKSEIINLPDGSVVKLSSQSRLSYPSDFGQTTRTVFLSGEAEFDVTKDAQKPFYVYGNELITKVLGTRFTVQAFEKNKNITVTVQSGQVSVYNQKIKIEEKKEQGVLLLPNQQIVFERTTEQFKKMLVPNPVIVQTQEVISFEFNETPVVEAFERLKNAYGVNLVFDAAALKDCQITASLNQESLFQKLNIISQIIEGSYEMVDGQILITAKGCQ
jgi:ferric-dicitrate binding protein FerR (iron transport regulator)